MYERRDLGNYKSYVTGIGHADCKSVKIPALLTQRKFVSSSLCHAHSNVASIIPVTRRVKYFNTRYSYSKKVVTRRVKGFI